MSAPPDQSAVTASPGTASGATVAGNDVAIAATNTDNTHTTRTTTVTPDSSGKFSTTIPVDGGTTVITAVATSTTGATASTQATIVFDFTPGTVVLDRTDATGDDNGPGTFQNPTAPDFHAGAFDIQRFMVIDDGTTVTFKLQTHDLSPTFGSPLGAQLVNVMCTYQAPRRPRLGRRSRPATTVLPPLEPGADCWRCRASANATKTQPAHTLGAIQINANQISRFITFSVPAASLGHPASGWSFSVVLTSQDGFSPDQARSFAATPHEFQLGVCAPGGTAPICSVNPTSVQKAVDVLTPSTVSQATELDPTLGPVVLQPVSVP